MKIPLLQPILMMTYVLTTSATCWKPFLSTGKILHVQKKQNKAVRTQIHNVDINVSHFKFKRFVSFYIESQYLLLGTNIDCRSYNTSKYHVFDRKQTLKELKKVLAKKSYFRTSLSIGENNIKQKDIKYHEKNWFMRSFFEHFSFPLKRHFYDGHFYNFTGLIFLTSLLIVDFVLFFKRRKFQSENFCFYDHNTNEFKKNEFFYLILFVFVHTHFKLMIMRQKHSQYPSQVNLMK